MTRIGTGRAGSAGNAAPGVVSVARYGGRGYDCRLEVHGFHACRAAGMSARGYGRASRRRLSGRR